MDWPYQFLLSIVDVVVICALWKNVDSIRVRWFALSFAAGLILAALLARDVFHLMRLSSWLLFVHAPAVGMIAAALAWRHRKALAIGAGVCALVLAATGTDAFLIEPHALEVSHYTIVSASAREPLRIALVADLQASTIGPYEDEALTRLSREDPDLILLTGDYVQPGSRDKEAQYDAFRKLLKRHDGLGAPLGAFAVQGNVDTTRRWLDLFRGSQVVALTGTRSIAVNDWLTITGLGVRDSFDQSLRLGAPEGALHVVFGHAPDYALGKVDADLMLAGHTHGGQVQLPLFGPLLTFSEVPRAWASGATQVDDSRTLVVSRGIGMERGTAPPIRFLCRPEIVIIDVLPAAGTDS